MDLCDIIANGVWQFACLDPEETLWGMDRDQFKDWVREQERQVNTTPDW